MAVSTISCMETWNDGGMGRQLYIGCKVAHLHWAAAWNRGMVSWSWMVDGRVCLRSVFSRSKGKAPEKTGALQKLRHSKRRITHSRHRGSPVIRRGVGPRRT